MALLNIFKKKNEKERYDKKRHAKDAVKPVLEKSEVSEKPKTSVKTGSVKGAEIAPTVLVSPHITEKATLLAEKGVYVFKISPRSNKSMVSQAIKEMYGIRPRKVSVINMVSKKRVFRGHIGAKVGYKKAMVYLKEGDKIEA